VYLNHDLRKKMAESIFIYIWDSDWNYLVAFVQFSGAAMQLSSQGRVAWHTVFFRTYRLQAHMNRKQSCMSALR